MGPVRTPLHCALYLACQWVHAEEPPKTACYLPSHPISPLTLKATPGNTISAAFHLWVGEEIEGWDCAGDRARRRFISHDNIDALLSPFAWAEKKCLTWYVDSLKMLWKEKKGWKKIAIKKGKKKRIKELRRNKPVLKIYKNKNSFHMNFATTKTTRLEIWNKSECR